MSELLRHLEALERELHQPKARADAARLAELLHPQFQEFGRSGRSYTRAEILAHLQAEAQPARVHAQEFRAVPLADGVVLLTYRSAHVGADGTLERHTNRSSIWKLDAEGWQMLFHQGTPTGQFDPNTG